MIRKIKIRATSGGIHLFNRATGINVLIDEICSEPENFSLAPRQVSIALTNACNLSCAYCYAPKTPASLSFEALVAWLRELDENGTIGVGFGGGEPTLYPRLEELCKFVTTETSMAVTLTTNAHRLNEQLFQSLQGNINFIRVSMDGVGSTYEANRKSSFDDFIENIKLLRDIAPLGINYVVNSDTISNLDKALEVATALAAREFLLLPEMPTFRRPGMDERTSRTLVSWVKSYSGVVPLAVSENNADGLPTCDPFSFEKGLAAFVHIDATGMLKHSSYDNLGVQIESTGIISALKNLEKKTYNTEL